MFVKNDIIVVLVWMLDLGENPLKPNNGLYLTQ